MGRVTGMVTMDLNLAQDFASIDQYSLLLVLFDLRKSYGTVDHGRLIRALE